MIRGGAGGPRWVGALVAAGLLLLLLPADAHAWGPAVHLRLGLEALGSLHLLPPALAALLARHPLPFLYGSLAADISVAKKYAPVGRHCHHWHVGREILCRAGENESLRAAAHGYLSHLAADVLAHNRFVPRMLLLTSSTRGLGHSYWEHRVDAGLGPQYLSLARRIVTELDHERADALFDQVLSATLVSFRTSRRIFRGLIRVSDFQRWQSLFDTVLDASRWELGPGERELYMRHAFELLIGQLQEGDRSRAAGSDPIGAKALETARRLRREILRHEGITAGRRLEAAADLHFPPPAGPTPRWERRGETPEVADSVRQGTGLAGAAAHAPREA